MMKEKIIVLGGGLVGGPMARTTGYTATAAVRMLIEGLYKEPGIAPPELVGRHNQPCDFMIRCLRERRVICEEEVMGGSPILC
jgi:saccharopine dehydrogenase-like NADP-dependent oxidoreductase